MEISKELFMAEQHLGGIEKQLESARKHLRAARMIGQEKQFLRDRYQITIVDGHIEAECLTKEDRDKLAAAFEQEAILRVKLTEEAVTRG